MSVTHDTDSFTFEVPSDPAYLSTIRLFAGAVARHFRCSEDSIDDLKVVLSEACSNAIALSAKSSEAASRIRLTAGLEGTKLEFLVHDGGFAPSDGSAKGADKLEAKTDDITRALGVELIQALFPDAELTPNASGGTDIKFSLETFVESS